MMGMSIIDFDRVRMVSHLGIKPSNGGMPPNDRRCNIVDDDALADD